MARSLALGCGKLGMKLVMATPEKYQYDEKSLAWLKRQVPELDLSFTVDPVEAVQDAAAVYTDVWASMGQETEREARRSDFAAYQVNAQLMSHAQRARVHALPAGPPRRRGHRRSDRRPAKRRRAQAANRMHAQKGILAWMLGAKAVMRNLF